MHFVSYIKTFLCCVTAFSLGLADIKWKTSCPLPVVFTCFLPFSSLSRSQKKKKVAPFASFTHLHIVSAWTCLSESLFHVKIWYELTCQRHAEPSQCGDQWVKPSASALGVGLKGKGGSSAMVHPSFCFILSLWQHWHPSGTAKSLHMHVRVCVWVCVC